MNKNEIDTIVMEMVDELLKVERFTRQDFMNRWPYHPAVFGDLLTQAFDIVRNDHGIEFRPGPYGSVQRANYKETINRSHRQRKAALKKLERSAARADVSAKMATTTKERETAEKMADLQKLQLTAAKVRSRKRLSAV